MKLQIIYLTICSLSQAAYISRMAIMSQTPNASMNRIRTTSSFRPGVVMRPWNPRLTQASSHRMPYVMYRNYPSRYSMKHFTPTRMVTSPWKAATRKPIVTTNKPTSAEYEFVRAVTSSPKTHATHSNSGAIHTVPAPNLSLSEKPIVVLEENNGHNHNTISVSSEKPKTYDVTEKYPDPTVLHVAAKIEQPIGFSKSATLTQPDFQSLVQNGAALQLASELGLSAISLPQHAIQQPVIHQNQGPFVTPQSIPQQHVHQHFPQQQSIVPQQFTLHNFHTVPNAQEFMQAAPDGIVITPNALYQPDPAFLQKLQSQLLQRFPGIEFVPYAAAFEPPQVQNQQHQFQNNLIFPSQEQQHQIHEQQASQSQSQTAFKPSPIQYQTHVDTQPSQSQTQVHTVAQPQNHKPIPFQPSLNIQPHTQQPFVLLQNEQFTRQTPSSFVVAESQNQRYVVQRETQEGSVVTLVPQVIVTNATANLVEVTTSSAPQNITLELIEPELKPEGTTLKYVIETTSEDQKTTPGYYTTVPQSSGNVNQHRQYNGNMHLAQASHIASNTVQVDQHQAKQNNVQENYNNVQTDIQQNNVQENYNKVQTDVQHNNVRNHENIANIGNVQLAESAGNVVTDGFYSAINDVRAGAALAQVEKPQEPSSTQENITTTTMIPTSTINAELKPYFVQKQDKDKQNQTGGDIKPVLGVPFAKSQNSVNVAYTLLRSDDKEAKVAKDGSVYAGQIVEASVSEDQDFNKQKANLLTRRAPIRLVAAAENKESNITTTTQRIPQRVTVVKARIPPKSKLTFDDKTGEPVLRIYASYVDNPAQKEALASKLTNTKHVREIAPRKQDSLESWKAATVKALAKPHGFEPNPNAVTQFGLKLRSRSDDYVPLFDDYQD